MTPTKDQALAFKRLCVTPEGKEVFKYLELRLAKETEELVAMEEHHQTRRIQGSCRTIKSIISLIQAK